MLHDPLSHIGGNVLPHILLPATQILALALPPFRHRATIFVPLIVGLVYATWNNLFTTSTPGRAALVAQWPWYMGTLAKLIFQKPEELYWRNGHEPQEALNMGFRKKLGWSTMLYLSPRGVGWNYHVKGARPGPKQSRSAFLLDNLMWLAVCWAYLDASNLFMINYYYRRDISLENLVRQNPEPGPLLSWGLPLVLFNTLGSVYFPVQSLFTQISIVCVALGSKPEHWAPAYGNNPYDLCSQRRLWNSIWHQFLRKPLRDWTHGLMGVLGTPRGTRFSAYFQLYGAFFITSVGHGIVTYAALAGSPASVRDRFSLFFEYMMLQAVCIHIEDIAIWAYRQVVGGKEGLRWHYAVGLVWVICSWTYTSSWAMTSLLRNGIPVESPVPVPIWGPVLQKLGYLE